MPIRPTIVTLTAALALSACTLAMTDDARSIARGKAVYMAECAACHGPSGLGGGAESLGLGAPPPALTNLSAGNGGEFPREYVRRFVLGLLDKDDSAAMPDFATVGLRHVYPKGGADGEVLETDFESLLDYLESIQE